MAMLGAEGDAMDEEEEEEGGTGRHEAERAAESEVELRDFTPQGPSPA
jgi:hypothetical protein